MGSQSSKSSKIISPEAKPARTTATARDAGDNATECTALLSTTLLLLANPLYMTTEQSMEPDTPHAPLASTDVARFSCIAHTSSTRAMAAELSEVDG